SMPRARRMMLAGAPQATRPWIDAILHLAEIQTDRWSSHQAEAVALALEPGWSVQSDLADRLKITRQALNTRLKGAGFAAFQTALETVEGSDWSLVRP